MNLWRTFAALDAQNRTAWHAFAWIVVVYLINHLLLSPWLIEDAAISMAYARHFADGEGFVANPGAEPTEGFSNPTWTLLQAVLYLAGISPFATVKLFGGALGVVGLWVAWRAARRLVADPTTALVAPLVLAVNPQYIIWNAAGLENPLFVVLSGWGTLRLLDEMDDPNAAPWSAIALGLLAVTRPEGLAYALAPWIVATWSLWRQPLTALAFSFRFWAIAAAPAALWQAYRLRVFAWPFPNTYYAKLDAVDRTLPLDWDARSWSYIAVWTMTSGAFLTFFGLAWANRAKKRWVNVAMAIAIAIAVVGVTTGVPAVEEWLWSDKTETKEVEYARIGWLTLTLMWVATASLARPLARDRITWWSLVIGTLAYSVFAGGDWMVGWRWMSSLVLPAAVLTADATNQVIQAVRRRWLRWLAVGFTWPPLFVGGLMYQSWYLNHVDTTPFDIERRTAYIHRMMDRLGLRDVQVLDIDMGGLIWWGRFDIVDFAGLLDVPVAHHKWERKFVEEYAYKERNPEIVHIHGGWASRTRVDRLAGFTTRYVTAPHFTAGRTNWHPGTWIRKDLLTTEAPAADDPTLTTFGEHASVSWRGSPPVAGTGRELLIDGTLSLAKRSPGVRVWLALRSGERVVVTDAAPGFDYVPTEKWRPTETWRFRARMAIPTDFPTGDADFAIVVIGADGQPLPAESATTAPALAHGERRWEKVIAIVDPAMANAAAATRLEDARGLAERGECEQALATWDEVATLTGQPAEPAVESDVARCFARWADAATGQAAADAIATARRRDHRDAEVKRVGNRLAEAWLATGQDALSRDDVDEAYQAWRWSLIANPTQTALRRRLESLRDRRLEIKP